MRQSPQGDCLLRFRCVNKPDSTTSAMPRSAGSTFEIERLSWQRLSAAPLPSSSHRRGSIAQQLFSLALPIISINVLSVLMLAVDSALCGRLPNSEQALEAMGFA